MIPLRCAHHLCRLPWGNVANGVLMVGSRHGGEQHLNAVSLGVLYKALQRSRQPNAGWDTMRADDYAFTTVRPAKIALPVFTEAVAGLELVCVHCTRPWGYIVNGRLLVESSHGGESHINQIEDKTLVSIFGKRYEVSG